MNINDATTNSSGSTNTSYIYGDLLFGGTAPVEQITTNGSGATATFIVANQTGVQGVYGSSGTSLEQALYSTYGKQTIVSGSDITPFGFQGSYADTTGLIYLINRYYDPTTDQFLSIDPEVATTDQPYVFANDDPLNAEDPLGLLGFDPCTIGKNCASQDKKAEASLTAATKDLKAAVTVVAKHVGDIATVTAIGVCIGTAGVGCAVASGIALGLRVVQRSEEGVPVFSSSNYIDTGVTLASGGLLGGTSFLGEGAVTDSPVLTYLIRIHTALPDIIGWTAGQITRSDIP